MQKKLFIHESLGFIFTLILGTFLHYTYALSGENPIVGLFSAVNESVWEHLKLLFFPVFIYTIAEYIYIGKRFSSFFFIKSLGTFLGLLSIVILFYTYTGIIGTPILFLDISIFIFGSFFTYLYSYFQLKNRRFQSKFYNAYGISIFTILLLLFILFTIMPPALPLFQN